MVLGGCSSRVASNGEGPPTDDPDTIHDLLPIDQPQGPLGDPGPTPTACTQHPIAGFGTTWLDPSASSGQQRWLRCLSTGTEELRGRFVGALHETNLPEVAGTSVEEPDRVYDYPVDDRLANQPAAYYVVTEMALAHHAMDEDLDLSAIDLYTGPFFLFDSFYSAGESITLGRAGLPGNRLDVHIAAHEYGHHVIATLAPGLSASTLHEGMADFLSCVFNETAAFMGGLPVELRRPCDNQHRWPDDGKNVNEACQLLNAAFESTDWADEYDDELETIQDCLEMPPPYALEGHQTGMIVSGALWSLRDQLGEATVLALFYDALRRIPEDAAGDFGILRTALLEADDALFDGEHTSDIEAELALRGMLEDVGLSALEHGVGYSCLMTPEKRDSGRVPAGPLLPVARMRR